MGRSFLASTLHINQNVVDQRMRVEGMRDGEMALLLLGVKDQDKRQLPQIHPLHEVVDFFLCSTMDVTGLRLLICKGIPIWSIKDSWLTSRQGIIRTFSSNRES